MLDDDMWSDLTVHYDLRITEASNFKFYIGIKALRSNILEGPCRAFQNNIEQVHRLSVIPQTMALSITKHLMMLCQATFNVVGKPVMDDTEIVQNWARISGEYARVAHAHTRSDGFFRDKQRVVEVFTSDALNYHKYANIANWDWSGHYALLAAQVIGAWTALETLIEDVWVSAVNAHPELATGAYKKRNFTIEDLNRYDFNWNGRVGELLVDRMEFGHLINDRGAYENTFPRLTKVHKALASGKLEAAHCVRNSLVHDAGLANLGYEKARNKFHLPWRDVKQGQKLPLDGKNVAKLTSIIVLTGNRLLREVDCWLLRLRLPNSKSPSQGQ